MLAIPLDELGKPITHTDENALQPAQVCTLCHILLSLLIDFVMRSTPTGTGGMFIPQIYTLNSWNEYATAIIPVSSKILSSSRLESTQLTLE